MKIYSRKMTKFLVMALIAASVLSLALPQAPVARAETDGSANYGPFYCVRHGRGDYKYCGMTFPNTDPGNYQAFLGSIYAEGQGYGGTSQLSVTTCFSNTAQTYEGSSSRLSGMNYCKDIYYNPNYPDNCPDPDDSCNLWYELGADSVSVDEHDLNDYNYVYIEIFVMDAAARVWVGVSGRRVALDMNVGPSPVYEGDTIKLEWTASDAPGGIFLDYGGSIAGGNGSGFFLDGGSMLLTAGAPGTATFDMTAVGPGGSGRQEINRLASVTVLPRSGNPGQAGTIKVTSNIPTNWIISGPENFSGAGTFASYLAKPSPGDYIISVPELSGYLSPQVTPGISQTLASSGIIAFDIYYEEVLPENAPTGTLAVSSNIPTSWTISGAQTFNGSGTSGRYTAAAGDYRVQNVPSEVNYNSKAYSLSGVNPSVAALAKDSTVNISITYAERLVLNPPAITGASNDTCGQIKLSWTDNSDNEEGFQIYRSESASNGDYTQYAKIATVGANVTAYVDRPATGKSYYYIVVAYVTTPAPKLAASNYVQSSLNTPCTADLSGSITISAVNGSSAFDVNSIKDQDTVTIQIILDNLGPADGYVTKITDKLGTSLVNPRNLVATGPNLVRSGISGTYPDIILGVSGKKEVGGNKWIVKFDATVKFPTMGSAAPIENCAVVHYYDEVGSHTRSLCLSQILATSKGGKPVDFREVAP